MNNPESRLQEKGNALFLILIAVALFAALSYVVTQSTRTGTGSTEREKNVLVSSQAAQYPTSLRTAVLRMTLSGTPVKDVYFNTPASFGSISAKNLVFHPQGGGAAYQDAPVNLSPAGNLPLVWTYNAEMHVPRIGTDTTGGNDLIAFLPGVSGKACAQINELLGIRMADAMPLCTGGHAAPDVANARDEVDATYVSGNTMPAGPGTPIVAVGCTTIFNNKASGCFYDTEHAGGRYVFYSVILER